LFLLADYFLSGQYNPHYLLLPLRQRQSTIIVCLPSAIVKEMLSPLLLQAAETKGA